MKKKGHIDTSLILIISMFLLLVVFVGILGYIQPVVKYITLNVYTRKYVMKMEHEGGLSPSNLTNLKNDLTSAGFKLSDITINATSTGATKYGDDVTLEIYYNCPYSQKNIDGMNVSTTTQYIPMHILKSLTSTKG